MTHRKRERRRRESRSPVAAERRLEHRGGAPAERASRGESEPPADGGPSGCGLEAATLDALLARARRDAASPCAATRLAALKLLGVLLASDCALPADAIAPLLQLGRDDESSDVRRLAAQLVSSHAAAPK